MKEINKHTLIEALASLPEYEPPTSVWDTIQNDLVLQKSVGALPQYEPPTSVWEQISGELQSTKPKQMGRVVSMQKWIRYAAAAAVIGLIAFFGWNKLGTTVTAAEEFAYSTETVDDFLLKKDWNEDEDAFQYLLNICKEKVLASDNPEFKSLKMKLEELDDAKAMLEEAIGSYGTDANLIAQMREIEFARTDIVKKMIDNVI